MENCEIPPLHYLNVFIPLKSKFVQLSNGLKSSTGGHEITFKLGRIDFSRNPLMPTNLVTLSEKLNIVTLYANFKSFY